MNKIAYHLIFWTIFFFIWERISYFYVDNLTNRLLFTFYDLISILITFYLFYTILPQRLLFNRNKLLSGLLVLTVIAVSGALMISLMKLGLRANLMDIQFKFSWKYDDLVINRLFIVTLGAAAGLLAKLSYNWINNKQRIEKLEKENAEAQLNMLKSQVNPHFLFNTLNSIYVQMEVDHKKARESLYSFSQLLRYQLYEFATPMIPLNKEIVYLQEYVALQRLRMEEDHSIHFKIGKIKNNLHIAPLLLIVFVENAFKYSAGVIKITMDTEGNCLLFNVYNSQNRISGSRVKESGIGLQNTEKRLNLQYKDKYKLEIDEADNFYEIQLKIDLDEDPMPDRR